MNTVANKFTTKKNIERAAIVTGAASGIGRAAALLLSGKGYAVTIADIDERGGMSVVEQIRADGGNARFYKTDITDAENVAAMVDSTYAEYGRLDAAINSAGVPQAGKPVHELSLEEWDFCNAINLRGMFLCLKFEVARMIEAGAGSIVCISSAAAVKGLVNSPDYCASKAGVTGLVRASAVDYAPHGIRINALLPGGTDTPLAKRSQENNPKIVGTLSVPLGRMASPEEVAAGAVWLVSDESSYVTGACLAIDGGLTIC